VTVVRTGTFLGASGYNTLGTASIVQEEQSFRLELGDDFQTDRSPALDVRLCVKQDCRGGALDLGPLQAFSGRQAYPLPDDSARFVFAVVWCRAVQTPFGLGMLQ
jgi:hypothetical protein